MITPGFLDRTFSKITLANMVVEMIEQVDLLQAKVAKLEKDNKELSDIIHGDIATELLKKANEL